MRRSFSIFLFFLYMVVLIRPVSPYLLFQANYDYINSELCEQRENKSNKCNGQCFLKKNLKEESKNHRSNPQRNIAEEEFNLFQPEERVELYAFIPSIFLNEFQLNDNTKDQYFAEKVAPPPQPAFATC